VSDCPNVKNGLTAKPAFTIPINRKIEDKKAHLTLGQAGHKSILVDLAIEDFAVNVRSSTSHKNN
jgi:hypothetical protein